MSTALHAARRLRLRGGCLRCTVSRRISLFFFHSNILAYALSTTITITKSNAKTITAQQERRPTDENERGRERERENRCSIHATSYCRSLRTLSFCTRALYLSIYLSLSHSHSDSAPRAEQSSVCCRALLTSHRRRRCSTVAVLNLVTDAFL